MTTENTPWVRQITHITIIERYDTVLYPIDQITLFDRLPELGWLVSRRMDDQGTFSLESMPSKGNSHLRLDRGNKSIGIIGNHLAEVLASYKELTGVVRELFDFAGEVGTDYVEFRYIGRLNGSSRPVETFASWWAEAGRAAELGSFLADKLPSDAVTMSPYGIRFAPSANNANRPNWAELVITPTPAAGSNTYHFDLIYRNESSSVVEQVVESADSIIESTLERLGGF
ncbi:MAG TPA: hypothetical protein VFR55_13240 [Dehalococcoidia bacterium]|nr:hypothetical protein [Dehalococcoidia bacterium]